MGEKNGVHWSVACFVCVRLHRRVNGGGWVEGGREGGRECTVIARHDMCARREFVLWYRPREKQVEDVHDCYFEVERRPKAAFSDASTTIAPSTSGIHHVP